MNQGGTPAYGAAGALTNIGRPIMAAVLAQHGQKQAKAQQQAQTSAMGRMLEAAQKARAAGQDPTAVVSRMVQENRGKPGYAAAGSQLMQGFQQSLAQSLMQPAKAPAAPKTREVKSGDEIITQEWDASTGQWSEVARGVRKPGIEVKNVLPKKVSETQSTIAEIERLRGVGDEKSNKIADRLEMNLTFGGKPPVDYIKARGSLGDAREGIAETYDRISAGQANPLSPKDRAAVKQSVNKARLAYAQMLNRGANFTESEQAMIDSILGGDPNDVVQRALRGDQSYLDALQRAGDALERRGGQMIEAFTTPGVGEFVYPWQQKGIGGEPAPGGNTRIRFDEKGNMLE
jgi:hypothetical protein